MCTIEIHLVVLPLANRWGTMLSSGKRIWFCISKLEPVKFGSSYDDDRWLYATEWPTCVCASQLGIIIHKFTHGNIYFISLDLSICWRWCWFLAIWSFAVSLLRISNLFHFDSSCSHAWPHCMYEPAFMGGALKMVDPQVTMVVSTLKWSSVGSFGGNAILMNCRLCPRQGTAVLAQARAEGAIGRSNGAKEMGGQRGALKTDLVLERLKWECRMR